MSLGTRRSSKLIALSNFFNNEMKNHLRVDHGFFFPVVFFVAPNVSRNEKVTKTKSFENLFFNNEMKDYF